ncbi:MAG TPA: hypothetical protein VG452_11115, partial [Egibacteraceae bacterium]|nr:hypothetical protein [Egibacteraceae bacterium]
MAGAAGLVVLEGYRLAAPPLLWPEARSALRQLTWRGDLPVAAGEATVAALDGLAVRVEDPPGLG